MTPTPETTIQRIDLLTRRVVAPVQRPMQVLVVGIVLEAIAGVAFSIMTIDPLVPGLVALAIGVGASAVALFPLRDPIRLRAFGTTFDHVLREREEWKAELGTEIPRTRGAMRSWLERHPDGPGRAALLLVLGRLGEADAAIEALPVSTELERFEQESLRQTSVLYRGQPMDLQELRRLRNEIRDPTIRRDRAQCIATLEAYRAAEEGGNPLEPLANAWPEADGAWARRPAFLMLRLLAAAVVLMPVLIVSIVVVVRIIASIA